MENALVAGGAGFIGSHLCEYLLNSNYSVTCVDNLLTGSKHNIEHLLTNPNFKFIEADVTSKLENVNPKYIFHLSNYLFIASSDCHSFDFKVKPNN